jgi:hypothetical protein
MISAFRFSDFQISGSAISSHKNIQIWMKKNEACNFASNKAYKQDYTKWESENREVALVNCPAAH